jgi:hypothetical protein
MRFIFKLLNINCDFNIVMFGLIRFITYKKSDEC